MRTLAIAQIREKIGSMRSEIALDHLVVVHIRAGIETYRIKSDCIEQ